MLPGCARATGAAALGIGHKTPRKVRTRSGGAGGQPPTEASLSGASLPGTSSVLGAAAAGTFMPREQGGEAPGLPPGLC